MIAAALLVFSSAALAARQQSGGPQTLRGEIMFLDRKTGRFWLRPEGANPAPWAPARPGSPRASRPAKDVIVFVLPGTELRRGQKKLSFEQLEPGAHALVKVRAWGAADSQAEASVVEILRGPGKAPAAEAAIFGRIWQIQRGKSLVVIRQGRKKFEILVTPNAVITDGIKRLVLSRMIRVPSSWGRSAAPPAWGAVRQVADSPAKHRESKARFPGAA
jgi:hypothetical protein